ncbi:hypothetical protein EDC01DRAFT_33265 [Geopyxis carbonaria]|nr:hypothetical protein EDC01DRAFT_33265 [Geopyxis carbonaria]
MFFAAMDSQRSSLIVIVLFAVAVTRYCYSYFRKRSSTPLPASPPEKPSYKKPTRKPGVWTPLPFTTPTPAPYPDWSLTSTPPLPYRPFRHGPNYFITMGLRKMAWDEWIELDNEFPSYHAQKAARIAERGARCCHTDPVALPAAYELLSELAAYLPARYPSLFRRTPRGLDNLHTGESFDIEARPLAEDPMQMAARLVQDDLAIMVEGADGVYYLKAGATLLTGFWRLEDKLHMSIDEIHLSGDVPGFKQKLQKGMNNFFSRVMPDGPVLRNNYFIQVDDALPWSHSIGSEDEKGFGWFTAEKDKPIEDIFFRSERQSLRRLPKSGGVVFTIRTYFVPIVDICKEPYVPGRLASAVRSWDDKVALYKGKDRYEKVLLEYLDQQHQRQLDEGLDVSQEDEVRSYPW